MAKGLVISDAGPIFSLAIIDGLEILDEMFGEVYIPNAVWEELRRDKSQMHYHRIEEYFRNKVKNISGQNNLTFIMDYGESESVILYQELDADFLLIDDKKARNIAESWGLNCIGTLGVLSVARKRGIVDKLKPIFEKFRDNKRYYSVRLLNVILKNHGEREIENLT